MNLLAHSLLSEPARLVRLGNVLCDFVPRSFWDSADPDFRTGMENHLAVDSFSESHPAVLASRARLEGYGRFSNPLIDVFYDHFLVRRWDRITEITLTDYVDLLYNDMVHHQHSMPPETRRIIAQIVENDWLRSYEHFDGLGRALTRMERRLEHRTGREVDLQGALVPLKANYDAIESDFDSFWKDASARFMPKTSARDES